MVDPVVCSDGYTYDRSTALRLQTSPFTRESVEILVDNVALRSDIFDAYPDAARTFAAQKAGRCSPTVPEQSLQPRSSAERRRWQPLLAPMLSGHRPSYVGALVDGRYVGEGRLAWPCGTVFVGQLDAGVATGPGRCVVAGEPRIDFAGRKETSGVYVGAFYKGRFDGEGEFRWNSNALFTGEWSCGRPVAGVLSWPCGDRFEGWFDASGEPAKGVYTWRNGDWLGMDLSQRMNPASPAHGFIGGRRFSGVACGGLRAVYKVFGFRRSVRIPEIQAWPVVDLRVCVAQGGWVLG